jgi:hypothetical protein
VHFQRAVETRLPEQEVAQARDATNAAPPLTSGNTSQLRDGLMKWGFLRRANPHQNDGVRF